MTLPLLVALGCSGPGALQMIQRAQQLGWGLFGVSTVIVVLTALAVRRSGPLDRRAWPLGVALLHPGLISLAKLGDCGRTSLIASAVLVALVGAAAVWVMRRTRPRA